MEAERQFSLFDLNSERQFLFDLFSKSSSCLKLTCFQKGSFLCPDFKKAVFL